MGGLQGARAWCGGLSRQVLVRKGRWNRRAPTRFAQLDLTCEAVVWTEQLQRPLEARGTGVPCGLSIRRKVLDPATAGGANGCRELGAGWRGPMRMRMQPGQQDPHRDREQHQGAGYAGCVAGPVLHAETV